MNIVILTAGGGTRMRSARPKALHPLAGRPLLTHVLETARALQPVKQVVVVSENADDIRRVVAAPDIDFAVQPQPLGTGHALQCALSRLNPALPILVLYGDVPLICAATLKRLIQAAGSNRYGILTAILDRPAGYGRIVRDSAGCVLRIVEDRDANGAERAVDEINTGIVSIPAGRAAGWLAALNTHNAQGERYLTDTVECAVADGVEIVTVQPEDRWEIFGVNSQAQRTQLERIVQRNIAHALLNDGVRLADAARIDVRGALKCGRDVSIDVNCVFEGRVVLGDGVCIGPNCVLKNAVIDAGAVIRAFTHIEEANIGARSVIGPYARLRPGAALDAEVHIGNFVEVKSAHLKQGAKVNHLSYIGDADIGARVNLGAGAITCNYDGARKHRTVIEDDVFIGSDTQLVAPVRVARGATIAAGTTVWKDVPERALALNEKTQIARLGYRRPEKSSKKDFK